MKEHNTTGSIIKRAMSVRHGHQPKAKDAMNRQQEYYNRLKKAGIAKQEAYNLRPASMI